MGGLVAKLAFVPPAPSYSADLKDLIWITTKRGQRIPAIYIPFDGASFTILFSHANAEDLGHIVPHLKALSHVLQVNVLGYEYTGYGRSTGSPSEKDCYYDIAAAYAYLLQERNALPRDIILFGRSLGSGPTCELASRAEVGGVILQSAFTSCVRVAYDVPRTPPLLDAFCNLDKVGKIDAAVLVVHGTHDDVVPTSHGKQLFRACRRPHRPLWVRGAGHNDIEVSHSKEYYMHLQEFVWSLDPRWRLKPGSVFTL
mmetsp:Transcript_62224/g.166965  ORF Transcript_62224/g.166965 Transcript_62224/m.166965 type:complete len:256 (-) Transcript_62224:13-780(-)